MHQPILHSLPLTQWRETRETIRSYTRLLSGIRKGVVHSEVGVDSGALSLLKSGFSTGPLPIPGSDQTAEVRLDLCAHRVVVGRGRYVRNLPLSAHSLHRLFVEVREALNKRGIQPDLDENLFSDESPRLYDPQWAESFIESAHTLATVFERCTHSLSGQSTPIQFDPAPFQLVCTWSPAPSVPNAVEPEYEPDYGPDNGPAHDVDSIICGFSTGDDAIPAPYLFLKYLDPKYLDPNSPCPPATTPPDSLPAPARWYRAEWTGLLIFYEELLDYPNPDLHLLDLLQQTLAAAP